MPTYVSKCAVLTTCIRVLIVLFSVAVLGLIPLVASAAWVATDKPEYAPGETVRIRGAGFGPAEVVTVQVTHADGDPLDGEGHDPWDATTNGSGGFLADWVVPYDDNVDEELLVTATGQTTGIVAYTTFLDANTHLIFISIPTSVPPSTPFSVTARLTQDCGGDPDAPLAGRTLLFFLTEGNCGVDVGQSPNATDVTDAFGDATVSLTSPPSGSFGIRVKFLGEDKPDPCPNPGNSACDPNDSNANKRCVSLANSNLCQTVSSEACDPLESICPPDITVGCETAVPPPSPGSVLCSGGCAPVTTSWVGDGPLIGGPCGGTISRTYRCTDAFGNTSDCIQTITVDDNTPPSFPSGCDQSNSVQCVSQVPSAGLGGVGPIDNCDVSLTFTHVRTDNGGAGCVDDPRIITDTYTATDDCGNSAQCQRVWTVIDNTPPTITCPPGFSVECLADIPSCNPSDATASDNCGTVTVTCSDGPLVGGPCGGTVTRTFVATDACGNSASCTQVIIVDDNTPPSISCPPDLTVACGGSVPACDPSDAIAADNCGIPTVTCSDTETSTGFIRTFTATDDCGNQASCTQVITVEDDDPPDFVDCPPSFTVACIEDVPPCPTTMPVFDECLGLIVAPVTCVDGPLEGGPCGGTITRTITVTDSAGNTGTCTQVITVDDEVAPEITCPPAMTVQCDESSDPEHTGQASATDNCDDSPVVTHSDVEVPGSCAHSYTIVRTWTATDFCGNSASCDQIVTVVDSEPPVLACPPSITVECNTPYDPSVAGSATADDNCGAAPVVEYTDAESPGSCPQEKVVERTWTATDACGNSASCVQLILVEDTQPPVLDICGDGGTFDCVGDVPSPASGSASDACDPDVSVSVSRSDNGGAGCAGDPIIITDTYVAIDDCGNTASCERTYTVIDDVAPTFANGCGANGNYQCAGDVPPPDLSVVAEDNCGGPVTVTAVRTSNGGSGCTSSPLVFTDTYTAVDACGNQAQCTRTHTVVDNVAPAFITCPPPTTVEGLENLPPCDGSGVVASDNCGGVTITCSRAGLGGVGCGSAPINVSYTYTATDGCGNSATCVRVVTVILPPCNFFASLGLGSSNETEVPIGSQLSVPLRIDSLADGIGAVAFACEYDPSVYTLLGVTRGAALAHWKYFTYENDQRDAGVTGRVAIKAIADPAGSGGIPSEAFLPTGIIATLNFAVSPDRQNEGRLLEIVSSDDACDDNCLLSRDGAKTYIRARYSGSPCPLGNQVVPALTISSARTRIVAPVNSRGDLNMNGAAYEVGDAVLFVEYLSGNHGAFSPHPQIREMQFDASDINGDGVRMAVSDLVYLIRIVSGEIAPLPGAKIAPGMTDAAVEARLDNGLLTVTSEASTDIGGVLLTLRHQNLLLGSPTLSAAAASMQMRSQASSDGHVTVLIYGWERNARIAAGRNELFTMPIEGMGAIELVGIDVSDANGALLPVRSAHAVVPESYALLQNYPNPFNAGTVIPFVLKDASEWSLTVFNILGQTVWETNGYDAAGTVRVNWTGQDRTGITVPSGVYFYRVATPTWNATKKMTILK